MLRRRGLPLRILLLTAGQNRGSYARCEPGQKAQGDKTGVQDTLTHEGHDRHGEDQIRECLEDLSMTREIRLSIRPPY